MARSLQPWPAPSSAQSWRKLPAAYVAFDILALAGTDVRTKPYAARRALLEDMLGRQLPPGLVLMPMTTDLAVARTWMLDHSHAGVEGVGSNASPTPTVPLAAGPG
jgi:ATP-dependent DNA ligase